MLALLRSARSLPTWWHERDHGRRPAGGTRRAKAAAHRPAAHARGLGPAPPGDRLAAVGARGRDRRLRRGPGLRPGPRGHRVVPGMVFALAATHPALGRRARASAAVLGLITASAVTVHLSGGVV